MPPATSATEDLRELRWPRSVGPSIYLAPTSAAHPTIAHPNSSQQRRVRPGLPTHPRHGDITGSQPKSRTVTPSRWPSPRSIPWPRRFATGDLVRRLRSPVHAGGQCDQWSCHAPSAADPRWRVQSGPWHGSAGTVRIPAAAGRHPKVPARWNLAARRSLTRRCYGVGKGAVSGTRPSCRARAAPSVRLAAPSLPRTWA